MKPHESRRAGRQLRRVRQYLDDGQSEAAMASAESLNRDFPELAIGWFWRSLVHMALGEFATAIAAAERALAFDDQRAEVHSHLARCHLLRGDAHLAMLAAERALALNLEGVALLDGLGTVLSQCGDQARAVALHERAARLAPDHPGIAFNLAISLRLLGRIDAAVSVLERVLAMAPNHAQAHWTLAQIRTTQGDAQTVAQLANAYKAARPDSIEAATIDFARFREFDAAADHTSAAVCLLRANAVMQRSLRFNSERDAQLFERLERHLSDMVAATSNAVPETPTDTGPVPLFIVGMPCSGTSLVERLLGNHPEVQLGGESQDFNVCIKRELGLEIPAFIDERIVERMGDIDWSHVGAAYRERLRTRFGNAGYVTDKLSGNYAYVAAIAAALPEARIVHVVRDPMDNCYAMFRHSFGAVYSFAYDQQKLAEHYVRYARFMRRCESVLPMRVFPLRYEQLISVPTLISRQLYRYCGLEWFDGAQDPAGNDKPVATATRIDVCRHGNSHGIGAWAPYATQLQPMRKVLADAGLVART